MSQIMPLPPVKLIVAAFAPTEALLQEGLAPLADLVGPVDYQSPPIRLDDTPYYASEMGPVLFKQYLSFAPLGTPADLPPLKLAAMNVERTLAVDGQRRVNLDPGYIFAGGLVLSTAKFSGHRLYLGEGLWGELTLHYHRATWAVQRWTYPDYQRPDVQGFLSDIRRIWAAQAADRLRAADKPHKEEA